MTLTRSPHRTTRPPNSVTLAALLSRIPRATIFPASAADRPLSGIAISEPGTPLFCHREEAVLGVGIIDATGAAALLESAAGSQASAVVLRSNLADDPLVQRLASSHGLAAIGIDPELHWAEIMEAFARTQTQSTTNTNRAISSLADAAANALGGPVTIEDAHNRVLGYSAGQEDVDETRIDTIMGRSMSADVISFYRARGVFRHLNKTDESLLVPAGPANTLPRIIVPIRDGNLLIGSIWAAVHDLPAQVDQRAVDPVVSAIRQLLLTLLDEPGHLEQHAEAALQSSLAAPSPAAAAYAGRGPWRVAAVRGRSRADSSSAEHAAAHLADLLHSQGWRDPLCVAADGRAFVLLRTEGAGPGTWAWLTRIASGGVGKRFVFAVGGVATTCLELARSRCEADELAALLDEHSSVLVYEQEWARMIIVRALSNGGLAGLSSPLHALREHDLDHGTDYVATLDAWLSYPADPRRAATVLHVHPNTLRYRIRKISEIVNFDLTDPSQALALRLQAQSMIAA